MTKTKSIALITSMALTRRNIVGNNVYGDVVGLHESISFMNKKAWALSCEGEIPEDIADMTEEALVTINEIESQIKFLHDILDDIHSMLEEAIETTETEVK